MKGTRPKAATGAGSGADHGAVPAEGGRHERRGDRLVYDVVQFVAPAGLAGVVGPGSPGKLVSVGESAIATGPGSWPASGRPRRTGDLPRGHRSRRARR